MTGRAAGTWLLRGAALASPPLLTYLTLAAAVALDRLHLGPSAWQLLVIYLVGPGALTAGLAGALAAAHLLFPVSRLGRAVVVVAEMLLVVVLWGRAFPVKGWQ